jgi:hypothetical protein
MLIIMLAEEAKEASQAADMVTLGGTMEGGRSRLQFYVKRGC